MVAVPVLLSAGSDEVMLTNPAGACWATLHVRLPPCGRSGGNVTPAAAAQSCIGPGQSPVGPAAVMTVRVIWPGSPLPTPLALLAGAATSLPVHGWSSWAI